MSRYTVRKDALDILKEIDDNKKDYLTIHYSCESFFNLKGKSPRITSIAVENLESGQAELFAIYKTAEIMGKDFDDIDSNYPEIEKKMLHDFFEYAKSKEDKTWLHWNMRDSIFGFHAIEHRYEVLSKEKCRISFKQLNIAKLLKDLYGVDYIKDPKMINLMDRNKLTPKNFLNGKDEATAFEEKKYYELSMSTAGKVRMFTQMLNLAIDKNLITDTNDWELYGDDLKAKWHSFKEKPYFTPISWIILTFLGTIIGHYITLWLN